MREKKDFLFEIGTEEMPPLALEKISAAFTENIKNNLTKKALTFEAIKNYFTPRRIAILITNLASQQPEQIIEKRGPAIKASFDDQKNPTKAAIGFAKSCNTTIDKLSKIKEEEREFLFFKQKKIGESTIDILPNVINESLKNLPIPKLMRWGEGNTEFVRPVHWILMLYGNQIMKSSFFEITADNKTYGHRFHYPKKIEIKNPAKYVELLEKEGFVIADFNKRKNIIKKQIAEKTKNIGKAIVPERLLNEVANLVEFPVALLGNFDKRFLKIPSEVLISTMQKHQRYFSIVDKNGKLLPHFITISNIKSKNQKQVIEGNERVIRARLTDAEFFYQTDLKINLESRASQLKKLIFQHKLGTMYDKTNRLVHLSEFISGKIDSTIKTNSKRAAFLAKADLMTEMVGEFPNLQGYMGYFYAKNDNEEKEVCEAIQQHYWPRVSGDNLPKTKISAIVAIADRIDTLVGIFGINKQPTGEKDPYGLRRAALGLLRILIEKHYNLDLKDLIKETVKHYQNKLENKNVTQQTLDFILERLKTWYLEKNVTPQTFASVLAKYPTNPLDFDKRIKAVQQFQKLKEAEPLSAANKRVGNILKKSGEDLMKLKIDDKLLIEKEEQELNKKILEKEKIILPFYQQCEYTKALKMLAELKPAIDKFFDKVMVMAEDKELKLNRLALLNKLHQLFTYTADIALLSQ